MMNPSTASTDLHRTAPRLFVSDELAAGAEIAASAEQAHYLGVVLRRVSGDIVRLFNGVQGEWATRLNFSRRDRLWFRPERQLRPQASEDGPWLVFALLKRDATDLVVRQAVELGVSRILPVITDRTNAARINQERARSIAIESAEQSERLTVPPIDSLAQLRDVLVAWPADRRLFAAMERVWPTDRSREAASNAGAAAILVGPEGGFTEAERARLDQLDFVSIISLAPYVLRAETAATAGLALLLRRG
jgi:16S rRNA (uracil1498-N3)-methyltransferase